MPSPRLTKEQRDSLLTMLRSGHDLEAAAGALGLTEAQIELARDKYGTEIAIAFKTGTAKLRTRIMESALSGDNAAVLMRLLEQREQAQAAGSEVTQVTHRIVAPRCEHCGNPTTTLNVPVLDTREAVDHRR
jgi:hypothetical protein